MGKYIYGALVCKSDCGGYWAEVPDLPGCYGQGDTFIAAVESISNGIETHLAAMVESGIDVPVAKKVDTSDGDAVYVYADLSAVSLGEPSVSAAEAARRLNVTPGRVSQLLKAGKLIGERSADGTMVTLKSIEGFEASPRVAGRPKKAASA